MAIFTARVTPPADLQPAIDALTDKGKEFLKELAGDGKITPDMLAKAADFERGELRGEP